MSRKSHKNKLNCEGKNFDFFTVKRQNGTLHIGFNSSGEKHITIIPETDGISVHLTKPGGRQRLLKISSEEARKKLSFEGFKIVNVEPLWELWYPKENIVSITYELTNKGKLPKTFIDAGKNHFDSLVSLAIKNGVLDVLFERITYQQLLNGEYVLAHKVDKNGTATSILAISTTLAAETPLFSKETEDLLNKILSVKTLMPE